MESQRETTLLPLQKESSQITNIKEKVSMETHNPLRPEDINH